MVVKPPIVLFELGVLASVFDSVTDAEQLTESYDAHLMEAYDSVGQKLRIVGLSNDRVKIEEHTPPLFEERRLREAVVDSLVAAGVEVGTTEPLSALLRRARSIYLHPGRRSPTDWLRGLLTKILRQG